jgi:hypothetical protein
MKLKRRNPALPCINSSIAKDSRVIVRRQFKSGNACSWGGARGVVVRRSMCMIGKAIDGELAWIVLLDSGESVLNYEDELIPVRRKHA